MVSAARHNELVDFILESEGVDGDEIKKQVLSRFGDFTFPDLDKAMVDAAGIARERQMELDAQADELERFMPLFEGASKGELLVDIARRKASDGNALALEFLKWCEE